MKDDGFYERLRKERGDDGDLSQLVTHTVEGLVSRATDENRPGMLLGKIQSGKTREGLIKSRVP